MRPATIKLIRFLLQRDVDEKKNKLLRLVEDQDEVVIDQKLKAWALEYRAAKDILDDFEDWENSIGGVNENGTT